jgi:histidinol dehydrogenase
MIVPILETSQPDFDARFAAIRDRGFAPARRLEADVKRIVDSVRRRGDKALCELSKRLDGVTLTPRTLRVSEAELDAALEEIRPATRRALRLAAKRIAAFHGRQREPSWRYTDAAGIGLGQTITPLRRAGVYVPGGHAAYPSSVLMNAVPARVAGVDEVIMVTPPHPEGINPAVLAAARIAGVTAVYRIGGAQAVAALAYGTKTVPRVDKIVGPGNSWVQAAKKLVYGVCDIDKIAGPSEVLVIADAKAPARYVAADLLAQAEHGSGDECAVLLTPSRALARAVQREIEKQLVALPRRKAAAGVLRRRAALVVVRSLDEAVEIAEQVAPEHLEIMVERPRRLVPRLRNAGAVFVGPWAPAPLGDYMAGPNHVLPTGGSARFFSPLGTYDFVKRTNIVSATREGLRRLAPAITELATLERYQAHANAVLCRFDEDPSAADRRRTRRRRGAG